MIKRGRGVTLYSSGFILVGRMGGGGAEKGIVERGG